MPANTITYSFVGSTAKTKNPNIQGAAISRNMFSGFNGSKDDARRFMQSCPGIKYLMNLGDAGQIDGMYVPSTGLKTMNYTPSLFVAYNGNIYRIDNAYNTEVIGQYTSGNKVEFAESGGERAVLLWVDGVAIYGYDLKEGESVSITLPKRITENLYVRPTHIAVVSGSIVINDLGSGYVYYSIPYPLSQKQRNVFDIVDGQVQYEEDEITVKTRPVDSGEYCFLDNYGVQKYFNAESSSDKVTAVYSVGALLTLYGPSSIEFWQRGDSESSQTWQRTSYTINKEQGLEAKYSLASVNQTQFCIGTGKANAKCILMIEGTKVSKISEEWLDRILNENEISNTRAWTYSKNNHSFYLFTIGNETYCYDIMTGEWHIRSSRNFYTSKNKPYMPLYAAWFNNKIITGCCENGNLYILDDNYYREDFNATDSLPLYRVRQTPVITANYRPFSIFELALECNAGNMEFYNHDAKALLQISNDGGNTFGNVIESSLGKRGEYWARLKWLNLGMVRQCVLKVMFSEDSDFVISDSSIRYQELNTGV
jgi:hypothetical protein